LEIPIAAAIGAVITAGAIVYTATHIENVVEHGGVIWAPALPIISIGMLEAAARGYGYVRQCRDAKRRGAELARRKSAEQASARARAQAGALWKRAAAAARGNDCATVVELDPQILELDLEFHAVVFARDVAIARCLATK
jgi:hypothetical protein